MRSPGLSQQRPSDEVKRNPGSRLEIWLRGGWTTSPHKCDAIAIAIGLLIGLSVCAPLLAGGRVFLLDWAIGPHLAEVTPSVLGLNGGLIAGVGGSLIAALLSHLFGGAVTWIPILAFFPVAMVGAGRLAGHTSWARVAAGSLYAVNPFVFNRLYVGHLPLLIGYALLPFAVASALRSPSSSVPRWASTPLWWAILTFMSPHFAWIFGVVVIGVVFVGLVTKQCSLGRLAGWFIATLGAFAALSMYILLPDSVTNLPTRVGAVSLDLYRTTGDPHLGLFANVLSLYGFWRTGPGPELPKDVVVGWPFLMFAILLIVIHGVWYGLSKSKSHSETDGAPTVHAGIPSGESECEEVEDHSMALSRRRLTFLLLFVGVVGYFLALGNQGPTGGLFLWAYDHVPFFPLMREPQKFLMLLALAYSVFFGWGVERFTRIDLNPKRASTIAVTVLVGFALPLGYTSTIFDGLDGQITSSSLPSAYQQANALMGNGAGNILYLPWHLYMEYPFTNGRVISNLGPTSFSRDVISGDDVQVDDVESQSTSPRSAYLQRLYGDGPQLTSFGALVAPLGVKFVVLAKAVDWASYDWLSKQTDLRLVFNDSALEVWRNVAYDGVGGRVSTLGSVSSFKALLALADRHLLGSGLAVVKRASTSYSLAHATSRAVQQLSPVAYRIASGRPGWIGVDAPYQDGWSLDGRAAIESAEGTLLVRVGDQGGVLQFSPWEMVHLGYIVSSGVFVCLCVVLLLALRRRTSGSSQ